MSLVAILQAAVTPNGSISITTLISALTLLVTAITPILLAIINKKQAKALQNTEETKASAVATAVSVEKVHIAVNSERTKLLERLEEFRLEVLGLSKDKAQLQERIIVAGEATPKPGADVVSGSIEKGAERGGERGGERGAQKGIEQVVERVIGRAEDRRDEKDERKEAERDAKDERKEAARDEKDQRKADEGKT